MLEFISMITPEIGFGILLAAIPVIVGLRLILKEIFNNNTNTTKIEAIDKDIIKVKEDLNKLQKDLTDLKLQLASNKSDTQIDNINNQISDMKVQISKLQDRLEKMTDLAIQIIGKD